MYFCLIIVYVSTLLLNVLTVSEIADENTELMKIVRRQLKENNYDYNPVESDEGLPFNSTEDVNEYHLTATEHEDLNAVTDNYYAQQRAAEANYKVIRINNSPYNINPDFSLRHGIFGRKDNDRDASLDSRNDKPHLEVDLIPSTENIYQKLTKISHKTEATTKLDQRIKQHDLVYYMDDSILVPTKKTMPTAGHVPEVKYKLLKMQNPSRRSNNVRRFVQAEDSKGGVFIFNVDAGPFPQFRLPADRRQYMQDNNLQEIATEYIVPSAPSAATLSS